MSELLKDLSSAKRISIDLETRDPNLIDLGCGGVRKDGYIIGLSVCTDDGYNEYLPIRHEGEGNLDRERVLQWASAQFAGPQPKLGARISYDLEWLRAEGVLVNGPKWDVQVAEPLLDENKPNYKLETLAVEYLNDHKDESGLVVAASKIGIAEKEIKKNLWKLSAADVAPYGRHDTYLPLKIFEIQEQKLKDEQLWSVFEMESELIEVLLDMRFLGVRVDLDKAVRAEKYLKKRKDTAISKLSGMVGREVDYWSNLDIARACETLHAPFSRTEKGNPSFTADWLNAQEHPFLKCIAEIRSLDRSGEVFIRSKIINMACNDRIHPSFWPVRGDDGGTKSGRFSSSNPNMQQVPARNKELSALIRSIFIPEKGCEWAMFDWSQQEPRLTVHYSSILNLRGAETAVQKFSDDPNTDYHQMVAELASIERSHAKTINLGLAYGMGKTKLAEELGLALKDSEIIFDRYHKAMPFIKELNERCTRAVEQRGYIRTILGRKSRFEMWGPGKWMKDTRPYKKEEAAKIYGLPIKRWGTHKSMNRLIQGSAADMMKLLLISLRKIGIIPHLTVHDDISVSIQDRKQARIIRDLMLDVVKLKVPLKVDVEVGDNWGELRLLENL